MVSRNASPSSTSASVCTSLPARYLNDDHPFCSLHKGHTDPVQKISIWNLMCAVTQVSEGRLALLGPAKSAQPPGWEVSGCQLATFPNNIQQCRSLHRTKGYMV